MFFLHNTSAEKTIWATAWQIFFIFNMDRTRNDFKTSDMMIDNMIVENLVCYVFPSII